MDQQSLRKIAEGLAALSQAIFELCGETEQKNVQTKEPEKEKAKYKLEDVRKKLAEKSSAGYTVQIRDLLKKHNADKLSDVKVEEYEELMEEAEEIGK